MTPIGRLTAALADRYRIEKELGQGGMATVFLAEDLKHGRRVAVKVLHPELAAVLGGERFLAEIRTTATLQHPNILQLFDSGSADGLLYYVMPFVEGESLRGRLSRERQLPIDDAANIARGVAAALDFAHRHGVIHRDIKPENILLQDGQPLVADFGIALAVKEAGGSRLTQTGLSLGTPQYMSPEQATGERVLDVRTDIFALGAVTYEMIGGEPPFTGTSTQAVIAKLMTEDPRRLSALRRTVPAHVEAAVHKAMEKLPADRFGSAAEFGAALPHSSGAATVVTRQRPKVSNRAALAVATLSLLAAAVTGFWAWRNARHSTVGFASRLALLPSPGESPSVAGLGRTISLSPDGQTIAYFARTPDGEGGVRIRRLDEPTSVKVTSSPAIGHGISFSADGRSLYFDGAEGGLEHVSVRGGSPARVPGVSGALALAWQSDGTLLYTDADGDYNIMRVRPGGTPQVAFGADSIGRTFQLQQVLPDDRHALVVRFGSSGTTGEALVLDLETGATSPLLDQPIVEMRYAQDFLVFVKPDNAMMAVGFDPKRRRVQGEPVPLADDVALSGAGLAQFELAKNGTLVYAPSPARSLVLVDRRGVVTPATDRQANYHSPRFSPDGSRIAVDFTSQDGRDVWMLDRRENIMSRITFNSDGHDPVWSADGRSVSFLSSKGGTAGIYSVRPGTVLPDSLFSLSVLSYSAGTGGAAGDFVAVTFGTGTGNDLGWLRRGTGKVEPIITSRFNEGWPSISPNGRWLAYVSDQSGHFEVYARPLDGADAAPVQLSQDGGNEPVWSKDGNEVLYRSLRGAVVDLVSATVSTTGGFRVVRRDVLFPVTEFDATQPHANYDISPDGKTFVMVRRNPSSYFVVIQNVGAIIRRQQRRGDR